MIALKLAYGLLCRAVEKAACRHDLISELSQGDLDCLDDAGRPHPAAFGRVARWKIEGVVWRGATLDYLSGLAWKPRNYKALARDLEGSPVRGCVVDVD